VFFASFLN